MRAAYLPPAIRQLVNELSKLPSVGEKTAFRLAQHLLSRDPSEVIELESALKNARENVRFCEQCHAYSENELCPICEDTQRDESLICVVEKPVDVVALEQIGGFTGRYHVLHGLWSPMRGVGPESINLSDLLKRIERSHHDDEQTTVKELVLATGTTVEGDATAFYIAKHLSHLPARVTRIAQGMPKGGELEYADESTLRYALEGRKDIDVRE